MKSPTNSYSSLKKAIKSLRVILKNVPDSLCTTNLHHLKIQSYILLSHAALEQYLEEVAILVLTESVKNYNTNNKFYGCIVSLIAMETIAQFDETSPRKKIKSDIVDNLKKFVNLSRSNHEKDIRNNNGIKLKDQKKLLLPVGIDPEQVDVVTANSLEGFGTKRGGIAHLHKIRTVYTKISIVTEVNNIVVGLRNIDEAVCKMIRTAF